MTTFKQWLLTEEIDRNGKTAIVYHRTKKIENALGILQYGSKSDFYRDHPVSSDFDKKYEPTSMFFVFDLESTMGKAGTYGDAIIKFKSMYRFSCLSTAYRQTNSYNTHVYIYIYTHTHTHL